MMNNKKIMVLAALLAFLVGLIGLIVCVVPGQTAPDKAISKYISAVNSCNLEKMHELSASSVLSGMLGQSGGMGNIYGDESAPADKIYTALQSSVFDAASDLPEDFKEIKSVNLVGCVDGELESAMGITGMNVRVVLEVEYVDGEGNAQSLYSTENIGLIKYGSKYYITG